MDAAVGTRMEAHHASPESRPSKGGLLSSRTLLLTALVVGAFTFLFPFYYMLLGGIQREQSPGLSAAVPNPANFTFANFIEINEVVDLGRTLLNSGIFTGGVILSTLVLGLLAGYAMAQLDFRGRGVVFNVMLLLLIVPFMLLMIPLYVMIVRWYGLADNFLGMIFPFAVNPTAVFIFRQFFSQIPKDLFDAARIDGASELQVLLRVGVPIARPAILTALIVTFIGPWNEFLWPFLITKQQNLQPLAVALGNFMSNAAARAENPFGAILAGATVLAVPAVLLFLALQKHFTQAQLGSGVKQ